MYAPYVYWKLVAYQNVTPAHVLFVVKYGLILKNPYFLKQNVITNYPNKVNVSIMTIRRVHYEIDVMCNIWSLINPLPTLP